MPIPKAQEVKLSDAERQGLEKLVKRHQIGQQIALPARITADQRCRIEALACEKPENSERPISQWSAREIADELKKREIVPDISPRHAARLLKRG